MLVACSVGVNCVGYSAGPDYVRSCVREIASLRLMGGSGQDDATSRSAAEF